MDKGGGIGGGAPTGCYKCSRPGHWSRDCPSTSTSTSGNNPLFTDHYSPAYQHRPPLPPAQKPKQKPPRRSRPKLTTDLLLSEAGLGHVLRYFPRALKCRGRGREVNDLRHLLGMYAEWNSQLLPYYGFDQFIHKVEQIGASKRVKVCLKELRERVSDGEDPEKLHEPLGQKTSGYEKDVCGIQVQENGLQNEQIGNLGEGMPQGIWEKATDEISQPLNNGGINADAPVQTLPDDAGTSKQSHISEEQRARMEANRLKAFKRVAGRSRSIRS